MHLRHWQDHGWAIAAVVHQFSFHVHLLRGISGPTCEVAAGTARHAVWRETPPLQSEQHCAPTATEASPLRCPVCAPAGAAYTFVRPAYGAAAAGSVYGCGKGPAAAARGTDLAAVQKKILRARSRPTRGSGGTEGLGRTDGTTTPHGPAATATHEIFARPTPPPEGAMPAGMPCLV